MTLITSWHQSEAATGERVRFGALECDGCRPPRLIYGTEDRIRRLGWGIASLDHGPHQCWWCRDLVPGHRLRFFTPSERPALPTFLIVGAGKAGTSSLHRYLSAHPQIWMPRGKEMKFFQNPDCLARIDNMRTTSTEVFPSAARHPHRIHSLPCSTMCRGEFSPFYPTLASSTWCASRWSVLCRCIQVLTNQAEDRPPREAFADPDNPFNPYLAQSRYATQLDLYTKSFPAKNVLVVDNADLLRSRRPTLARILQFIGADPDFDSPIFDEEENRRVEKRSMTQFGWRLRRAPVARALLRLPERQRQMFLTPIRRATSRRVANVEADRGLSRSDTRLTGRRDAALRGKIRIRSERLERRRRAGITRRLRAGNAARSLASARPAP